VAGRALPFASVFYVPYALLQASVALRSAGDIVDVLGRLRLGRPVECDGAAALRADDCLATV